MGKIYLEVLEKEREGEYLGKTVQVIPHVTNKIKEKIYSFEDTDTDIVITEIGGTLILKTSRCSRETRTRMTIINH